MLKKELHKNMFIKSKIILAHICFYIGDLCSKLSNLQPLGFDMGYIFAGPYQFFMGMSFQLDKDTGKIWKKPE